VPSSKWNLEYLPFSEFQKHLDFITYQKEEAPVVKKYHGVWKELIAWADGDQFSEWDMNTLTMKPVELRVRKKKVVINMMKPLGEAIDGKMDFNYRLAGFPNSSETKDIEAAQVSTKFLADNDYANNAEVLMDSMKFDLINTGNACITWQFDKERRDSIGNTGLVVGRIPSVFNIRPDPTAHNREEMRWFIEFQEIERGTIKDTYGVDDMDIDGDADEGAVVSDMNKYKGLFEEVDDKDKNEKTDIVAFYWEKKNDKFKGGRLIISTGKCILYSGSNPALGEIPFWMYVYKRRGNSAWGTGPYFHVQPIQREINRVCSITSEHHEGWRAKMIVPEDSISKRGAFTTDSFELLEYDPTRGEPHAANMPELSPQVSAWRDFLLVSFGQVANVHEVSYSQLPKYSSRAPASLFSMMLEQENMKIDPMLKSINSGIKEMGKFRLRLISKYYNKERKVKIVGLGEAASIDMYEGADIEGNYDVKLEQGVHMKQSRVVQQRLLLELWQAGVMQDPKKFIRMLGEGDIEESLHSDYVDESKARRENQAFLNGTWKNSRETGGVFIYLHDDDAVHMTEHTDLSKSEEASRMSLEDWTALQNHIMEHMQKMQALAMMAQEAALMAGGPQAAPQPQTMAEGAPVDPAVAAERQSVTMQ
jgi:hypothetical protein